MFQHKFSKSSNTLKLWFVDSSISCSTLPVLQFKNILLIFNNAILRKLQNPIGFSTPVISSIINLHFQYLKEMKNLK